MASQDPLCITIERKEQVGLTSQELIDLTREAATQEGANYEQILHTKLAQILRDKNERKCIREGYAIPNTTNLTSCSYGHFPEESLVADINYYCSHTIQVCRPIVDAVIPAKIVNKNMIGMIAEYSNPDIDGNPFLILIPQSLVEGEAMQELYDKQQTNMPVNVRIVSSLFQAGQEQITVIAKLEPPT